MPSITSATGSTVPLPFKDITALPNGYSIEQDQDGDWMLIPPEGVQIFSVPGEAVLLGRCTEEEAVTDALEYLKSCSA